MIKETIPFHDLDGNELVEDFWFNLFESELAELKFRYKMGIDVYIQRMIDAEDVGEVIKVLKEIILMAYGERDPKDPKRFIKSEELSLAFSQTEAYSNLFMKLAQDEKAAAEFMKGIIPKSMRSEAIEDGKKTKASKTN